MKRRKSISKATRQKVLDKYGGTFIGGMPAVYLKGLSEGYAWTGYEEIIGNVYENKEFGGRK